jgi:transcriptional regulator with XRE-family HTH domain
MHVRTQFAQRLRATRVARGLTQTHLAAMVDVHVSRISYLETRAARNPRFQISMALAAALDVDPRWLLSPTPGAPSVPSPRHPRPRP